VRQVLVLREDAICGLEATGIVADMGDMEGIQVTFVLDHF
jgi:hypothetical protein